MIEWVNKLDNVNMSTDYLKWETLDPNKVTMLGYNRQQKSELLVILIKLVIRVSE